MTLSAHVYAASFVLAGVPTSLPIKTGSITLDEGWSPYVQGQIETPAPALAVLAALDPRNSIRLTITASVSFGASGVDWNAEGYMPPISRTFSVLLRGRQRTHGESESTLALRFSSAEALLQDYAKGVTVTPTNNSGIAAIRAALTAAVPGAVPVLAMTLPSTTITNMLPNPGGEISPANWVNGGAATITRTASPVRSGTGSIRMYTPGGQVMATILARTSTVTDAITVTPGKKYVFSVYTTCTSQMFAKLALRFFDGSGVQVARDYEGDNALLTTTSWTRISVLAEAPPTAVYVWPIYLSDGLSAEASYYADDAMLHEGTDVLPPFTGSTPSTIDVNYSWTGTAHASPSRAVTKSAIDYPAVIWKPGVSAWDYMKPILAQMNVRLFNDENNVWRIVDNGYFVNGSIRIAQGRNVTDAADTISRDTDDWSDAVCVRYSWTEPDGTSREEVDFASTPGYTKVRTIDLSQPYPGPGAAAYILGRATGRGRVFDLTAMSDYSTTPGQEVVATLPDTPISTGYISAVTWDFATDEMTVKSRGLIETAPTAWQLVPPGTRWQDIPAGISWNTYTA